MSALKDIKLALRWARRNPTVTCLTVLSLSVGIGANTAFFSVIYGILVRPLAYPNAPRLVRIWPGAVYPKGALIALQEKSRVLAAVAGYTPGLELVMADRYGPRRLDGVAVSANFFETFGANLLVGRTFSRSEVEAARASAVLISERLWKANFGGEPGAVGTPVSINGTTETIIGVVPQSLNFPSNSADIWVPITMDSRNQIDLWGPNVVRLVGLLGVGSNAQTAQAEVNTFVPVIRKMFPWRMPDSWGSGEHVVSLQESIVGSVRPRLILLFSAVGLTLLITCANIANLLLARSAVREREMITRAALGATRPQIVRQMLIEGIVLSLIGGLLGVGAAGSILRVIKLVLPPETPRLSEISLDTSVLLFSFLLSVGTGLVSAFLPAIRASDPQLLSTVRSDGGRHGISAGRRRWIAGLVVGEITVAMCLVTAAGVFAKTLWRLSRAQMGFEHAGLITVRLSPADCKCATSNLAHGVLFDTISSAVAALPGITETALVHDLPLTVTSVLQGFEFEGHPVRTGEMPPMAWQNIVGPNYFHTMRMPVLVGMGLDGKDRFGSEQVAVVSQSLAEHFWPGQNPVGKRLRPIWQAKGWRTVTGVVADSRNEDPAVEKTWDVYMPHFQNAVSTMYIIVRSSLDVRTTTDSIRKSVANADASIAVDNVRTMDEVVRSALVHLQSTAVVLTGFALLAVLLGAIGIYSLESYAVGARQGEFALRMALGANARSLVISVVSDALKLAVAGFALGGVSLYFLWRLFRSLVYSATLVDPILFLVVAAVLAITTVVASVVPALRTLRVTPANVLRVT